MNLEKGTNYEIQIRDYIVNTLNKRAYLWKDTPEYLLIESNIIGSHNQNRIIRKENLENSLQDTGIDIIQVDKDDKCSIIQCKNGYKNGITMNDLSGFMCWLAHLDKLNGYVYYTNKLSNPISNLPKNNRIHYIKQSYIDRNLEINQISKIEYKPLNYQIDAKLAIEKYFLLNNRAILSLPCGTGKTFTSYLVSKSYDQIIIVSPLKQFAKQNLDRYIEYGYSNNNLLVNSDGERNIKLIEEFIKDNKKFLISATYCSIDIIQQCLKFSKNPLIIIDEFHNLSKNNMYDEDDNFNKVLYSDHRILFMSATPRIYELEYEDVEFDMETIFGKIVYSMTFSEAIKNKYITDYKIWLPSIHEDNEQLNNELKKELNVNEIEPTMRSKCNFLFSCILNNGCNKTIIYCLDNEEINKMIDTMKKLNEFYILDFEYQTITAQNTEKQRNEILNNFSVNNKKQLLFSIRILDECIDIPKCDSIYITYSTKSKIRTIQRISRCIRIDKNNPYKIGNIFIWCDEYENIIETLSGIKEYDINFKDKLIINETNFFGNSNIEGIEKDDKLIEKYIMGIKEYKIISWSDKLDWIKNYIDTNNKRPNKRDKDDKIKSYAMWLTRQLGYYKLKKETMLNEGIKDKFEKFINDKKYKQYFISNDDIWYNNLEWVKNYIDTHNKRPSAACINNDDQIRYHGLWINTQLQNYDNNLQIMTNIEVRLTWEDFISKYNLYFKSSEESWIENLEFVKDYINKNNKRPSKNDCNEKIKVYGRWLSQQVTNYNKNKNLLKIDLINKKWKEFMFDQKYKYYFT